MQQDPGGEEMDLADLQTILPRKWRAHADHTAKRFICTTSLGGRRLSLSAAWLLYSVRGAGFYLARRVWHCQEELGCVPYPAYLEAHGPV